MKTTRLLSLVAFAVLASPLLAEESSWTKELADRTKRGTLHGNFQVVRGDSGKWNDDAHVLFAPPIEQKPEKLSLDSWADLYQKKKFQPTNSDDNWLLFRTQQLDDNDRVWVERVERQGSRISVTVNQAIWQGRYSRNFTCYNVVGVNLGKLEPGKYEAKWIVKPLVFGKFEDPGRPEGNWPKDEVPVDKKPAELGVEFTVVAAPKK